MGPIGRCGLLSAWALTWALSSATGHAGTPSAGITLSDKQRTEAGQKALTLFDASPAVFAENAGQCKDDSACHGTACGRARVAVPGWQARGSPAVCQLSAIRHE